MKLFVTRHARFSELDFPGISNPCSADENLDFGNDEFFDCTPSISATSESASGLPPSASPSTTPPVSVEELFETPPSTPLLAVTAHKAPNEIIGDISKANIIPVSLLLCKRQANIVTKVTKYITKYI
jgi:hypothetical protein